MAPELRHGQEALPPRRPRRTDAESHFSTIVGLFRPGTVGKRKPLPPVGLSVVRGGSLTNQRGCLTSHTWGQILILFASFGRIRSLPRDVFGPSFLLQVRSVNPHARVASSGSLGGPCGGSLTNHLGPDSSAVWVFWTNPESSFGLCRQRQWYTDSHCALGAKSAPTTSR